VQRLAYDAHGKRRNPNWTDPIGPIASLTPRGFTGHEMDDESGLINMNAREYDPVLGRFLSADTIVGAGFGQGLNRYSYARNNPLSYTDPTGMLSLGLGVLFGVFDPGTAALVYANRDDIARQASRLLKNVSQIPYVGGLLSTALLTSEFGYVYGWSTGDWKSVGRAHVNGAIMAASMYVAPGLAADPSFWQVAAYVAESSAQSYATSYVSARANGMSDDEARGAALKAARSAAVITTLEGVAMMMRAEMLRSDLDERDVSGQSVGVRGDRSKLAGGRVPEGCLSLTTCGAPSPLGGFQGQGGKFLWMDYNPGSLFDTVLEAFSGPHDFFNGLTGWYNEWGQARDLTGMRFVFSEYVMNYAVNIVAAAPFAAATMVGPYTASYLTNDTLVYGQ